MFLPTTRISKSLLAVSFALSTIAFPVAQAQAETIDFGGYDERFKGRGDRVPPKCQVSSPSAAGAGFVILWACEDEDAAQPDIRTELWILKNGSSSWELVRPFLGFPAAMTVTEKELGTLTVKEGLPASFRVVGIDRAGNSTISPSFTVNPGDSNVLTCSMTLSTNGSETGSDGSTTGIPVRTVSVADAATEVIAASATAFTIRAAGAPVATTCEIDSVCSDDAKVSFTGNGVINSGTSSDVTVSVIPGAVTGTLSGAVGQGSDGSSVVSLSLSGTADVEGESASLSLECVSATGDTTGTGATAASTFGEATGTLPSDATTLQGVDTSTMPNFEVF